MGLPYREKCSSALLWAYSCLTLRGPVGCTHPCCPRLSNHMVISFPRNLDTIFSFPGGESLRGFVLVTVLVEKAAVPGIKVSSTLSMFCFVLPFSIRNQYENYFGELINIDEHRP